MTDSSDPRRSKSSRKKPSREPATIDLKAFVIDDGSVRANPEAAAQETVGQDTLGQGTLGQDTIGEGLRASETPDTDSVMGSQPDETIASGSEPPAEDVVASPEASLDSGSGTDTLPSEASLEQMAGQDTSSSGTSYQDTSTAETRADATPPPAPERRGSAGALLGSGLLGGLVGAGLVYGLQTWREPAPAQSDPRIAQLEQRVNALRQQPAAPAGQAQGDTGALEGRIQALETARGDLDQRLQAIQGTAQQAASQAQEALNRPAPEAAQPQASSQNDAALADLSTRLGALDEQVRTSGQSATNAANITQELDRRLADLDRRFGEREQRFQDTDRRLADLDRQLAESNRRLVDTDRRFGEQEQRLAALSQQAAENTRNVATASQTGTRVVLAGRLNDALQGGTPYPEVLDGVKKAGTDPARVAPLEPFAQGGAPTPAELAQSFEPVETAILRESRGPAEGWTDRILRMADKVVTVRPVNEPGGSGVPALVTRIRQALERGDVVEAAAAWDALPEPSRQLSEEWGRQVKAVAEAHRAAQAISSDALATLNRTTQ
ncbi:hypothetical protein VB618_10860 [Microvirga sp. CF3062]|uniref:hypothetical protein n=1 Tax=Microvirga sp. CF3062 TaxID=3110182 RepID=UPI002E7A2605|nr:hypothetical protein [Microvirga sp. CF3062]MEE1656701.1 hypothetical protein [Microvirga sp. CF3062]